MINGRRDVMRLTRCNMIPDPVFPSQKGDHHALEDRPAE
jgi:hypothetical protein